MSFAKDDRVTCSGTLPAGDGTVVAVHDVDGGTAYDVLVDGVGLCRFGEGDLAAAGRTYIINHIPSGPETPLPAASTDSKLSTFTPPTKSTDSKPAE